MFRTDLVGCRSETVFTKYLNSTCQASLTRHSCKEFIKRYSSCHHPSFFTTITLHAHRNLNIANNSQPITTIQNPPQATTATHPTMSATGHYPGTITALLTSPPPPPSPPYPLIEIKLDVAAGGLYMRGTDAARALIRLSKAGAVVMTGTRVVVTLGPSRTSGVFGGWDEIMTLRVGEMF